MPLDNEQLKKLLHALVTDSYQPPDEQLVQDDTSRQIVRSLNALHQQKQTLVRHYNEDIRNSEVRLRQIIETTPVGICITDEAGIFEYVNPTYCRLYGYDSEELIGNEFVMVVPPKDRDWLKHLHAEFMGHRYELRGEWQVVRKDGSPMSIIADAAYIIDVDGQPKKVTFVLDITARKEAEEALKDTVERLNGEIEERTRLEKAKTEVERMIRHDLRNPLNGIIAAAEILLADEASDEQRELYLMIRESGRKLDSMLSNSMDLIRMEEGTYQLVATELSLAEILRNVDRELSQLAAGYGASLGYMLDGETLRWDADLPMRGERFYLEDLFANLVRNAIEASNAGDVVSVRVAREATAYTVEIHNRQAVPESIRETFFDRYTTSGKRHGTGLGTYVARLIAESHGGAITFSSSEADGTSVRVTLPSHSRTYRAS